MALSGCLRVCRSVLTEGIEIIVGALPRRYLALLRATMFLWSKVKSVEKIGTVNNMELEGLSKKSVKSLIMNRLEEKWQRDWDIYINGRVLYRFISTVGAVLTCE